MLFLLLQNKIQIFGKPCDILFLLIAHSTVKNNNNIDIIHFKFLSFSWLFPDKNKISLTK